MLIVHGLDLSYFTGKLEGYLRAKGLPYRLEEMSTGSFRRLARQTGVQQMPQLELPDGRWLTDTVRIIDALETEGPEPSLTPSDPACGFIAGLIETFGDEHLWRPALYYRWAFADDARLMSARLASGMLRDIPGPLGIRRLAILWRQRARYLRGEGVTSSNQAAIEADYLDLLDVLEPVLSRRDWVMGDAPTRADIGLFGPMFRHFHCDPTPGRIMRARAPSVAAWVTRLWALNGIEGADARSVTSIPDGALPARTRDQRCGHGRRQGPGPVPARRSRLSLSDQPLPGRAAVTPAARVLCPAPIRPGRSDRPDRHRGRPTAGRADHPRTPPSARPA